MKVIIREMVPYLLGFEFKTAAEARKFIKNYKNFCSKIEIELHDDTGHLIKKYKKKP